MGGLVAALIATYTLTWFLLAMGFAFEPVSYTHLDVYKRQDDARSLLGEVSDQILGEFARAIAERDVAELYGLIRAQVEDCLLYTSRCV